MTYPSGAILDYRYSQGSALENYGYDALGNRASLTSNAGSSLYHYPANSNHLSSIQGANAKTYGYDAAGNLFNDGTRQFTYDSLSRLTLVTEGRTQAVYELGSPITYTSGPVMSGVGSKGCQCLTVRIVP